MHPTIAQARAGWERELGLPADDPQRNYRDDNHKPELIVALSERFESLSGLRPIDRTVALLGLLGSGEESPSCVRVSNPPATRCATRSDGFSAVRRSARSTRSSRPSSRPPSATTRGSGVRTSARSRMWRRPIRAIPGSSSPCS
ncbi:type I phosphomannose isomerase catalytic subunit [Microbacterium sp. Se63.02b]|uniref:type I phosphomannose isomerase catalytic subunit n=1 Tax=Microbacterium sp. Se63.02b TaxID=2709304 RepID=UPI0031F6512D